MINPLDLLSEALGYLMTPCYSITGNWWAAIAVFTLLTKIILMPISLWCQYNSLKMVSLMPDINRIKVKYFGDKEAIGEAQVKLFKEKHYHGLLSVVPLVIQLIILIGLIGVIYAVADANPGVIIGIVPFSEGGLTLLMPLAAGLSAFILGICQNKINPLQKEQSRASQIGTNALSIAISLALGFFVPLGVGFYWICSNLFTIFVQLACNGILKPKKYVDYEDLEKNREELGRLENLGKSEQTKENKKREKEDYKRFFSVANKHLVFYSEGSGFYKYFQDVIEYLLSHSNIIIHYVTSDPNDQIFKIAESESRIRPYYIGEKRLITLFMKMDADMVVMTMPDIDNYHLKRSYVRKDVEYVFIPHWMTSIHLVVRTHAIDNYDTIFCTGSFQIDEIRELEKLYGLREKKLIDCGYSVIDNDIREFEKYNRPYNAKPKILIAPSHQEDNILDSCIDDILMSLFENDWDIIVRPHPQYVKRYPSKVTAFQQRYQKELLSGKLLFTTDFSSNEDVYQADILITDWSTIAFEYSFSTKRPTIFINTKMKVINAEYRKISQTPKDILWRNEVGIALDKTAIGTINAVIKDCLENHDMYCQKITKLATDSLYHIGESGKFGAKYILNALKERAAKEKEEN